MNVDVGSPGNLLDLGRNLGCHSIVLRATPNDLNVDWGGKAEVQDLADDVRRLEEERERGEVLVQLVPQGIDVFSSRFVAFFEGDENLAIRRPDRGAVTESKVDAARWQANVGNRRPRSDAGMIFFMSR